MGAACCVLGCATILLCHHLPMPPPTTASPGVPTLTLGSYLILLPLTEGSHPVNTSPMSHPKAAVPAPKVKLQCPAEVPVPPSEMPSPPSVPRVVMVTDAWDPRDPAGN